VKAREQGNQVAPVDAHTGSAPGGSRPRSAGGQSSRQSHSAHHTEQVTIYYRWHPLHGQTIRVQRSVRQGREVWLCEPDRHTAAIPVWMTDRVACAALSVGPILVSVDALTELASLVIATRSAHDRVTDLP
jgi:hypothetical protein